MVSVILPFYNAEQTLRNSLDSLRRQLYKDFELILVDDGSTDNSLSIAKSFVQENDLTIQLIHQENKGVSAARNTGIDAARGEYLAFLDADDTLAPEALQTAISNLSPNVDIIGWDWTLQFASNGRYMRQADYRTPLEALKNLLGGTMRWNLWLFLIKKELLTTNRIRFIEGANIGEDMMLVIKAFTAANEVRQIHASLYYYNAVNDSSISKGWNDRKIKEIDQNVRAVESHILASRYADDLKDHISYLKLYVKLPLLISPDRDNYKTWYHWFPEANEYATANEQLPIYTRLLQWMGRHKCWTGIQLYYYLVYRLMYGLIYR